MATKLILGVEDQTGRPAKLSPDPGETFVVFDGRRSPVVLRTGDRLSAGEIRSWRSRKLVRVDIGEKTQTMDASVMANDGFRQFAVSFSLTWRVSDPVAAAQAGDFDIDGAVNSRIGSVLGSLDRAFAMDQDGADTLFQTIRSTLELSDVEFVRIERVSGRVRLDAEAAQHLAAVLRAKEKSDLLRLETQRATEAERARELEAQRVEAERVRHELVIEEEKLKLSRTIDTGRLGHEKDLESERVRRDQEREHATLEQGAAIEALKSSMAIQQQTTALQLERMRAEFELERQHAALVLEQTRATYDRDRQRYQAEQDLQLLAERLKVYQSLTGSPHGLVTLQLANDPSQVNVVINNAVNQQQMTARLQLEAVKVLMEGDGVEGFQLEETAKRVMMRFLDLTSGPTAGSLGLAPPSALPTPNQSDDPPPAAAESPE
jgi:hypothetical protein